MKSLVKSFLWFATVTISHGLVAQQKVMIDQDVLRQEGRLNMDGFSQSAPGIRSNLFDKTKSVSLSKSELSRQNGQAVIRLELNPENSLPLNRNTYKAMTVKGRLETKVVENEQIVDKIIPVSLQVHFSPSGKGQKLNDQQVLVTNVLAARLQVDSLIVTDSANLLNIVRKAGFDNNTMNDHQIEFMRFLDFELMMDIISLEQAIREGTLSMGAAPTIRVCEEAMQLNIAFPSGIAMAGATHVELAWNFTDNYGNNNENRINFSKNSGSVILPITEVNYALPLVFEKGWFSCRVRYLTRGLNGGYVQQSLWSNLAKQKIELRLIHEADYMNWQAITEFGENGKRKDIITYLDGTMRSRQAVTQTRTQNVVDVVVAETFYDHEGRPAIQALAAPVLKIPSFYSDRNLSPPTPTPSPDPVIVERLQQANEEIRNGTGRGRSGSGSSGTTTPGITAGFTLIPGGYNGLYQSLIAPEPTNQIPCPVGQAPLRYYPLFSVDSTGKAFSHAAFDPPGTNRCAVIQAPKMASTSGAALYYSIDNPQKIRHELYLPQAEGYPYTRQVFTADKTNRVLSSNMPGPTFKTGRGHDTRFFYSTPGQDELDMFLGGNAGLASFYQRVDMVDPNGQSHFEIKDELGKTVISGLSGSKSTSILDTIRGGFEKNVTYALANSPNDMLDRENGTRSVTSKFKIDNDNTAVIIDYQLKHNKLNESLCSASICFDCVYDLSVSLTDDACGTVIGAFTKRKVKFNQSPLNGAINLVCESGVAEDTVFTWNLSLNHGTYTVSRTLTVNEDVLNGYLSQIETRPLCSDITCQYRAMSEAVVDSNSCHGVLCGDETTWRRRYDLLQGANRRLRPKQFNGCLPYPPAELTEQQQQDIEKFNADSEAKRCKTSLLPCEGEMSMMLNDLSPEGQYAETRPRDQHEDEDYQVVGTAAEGDFNPPRFSVYHSNSILSGAIENIEPYKKPRKNRFNTGGDFFFEEDGTTRSYVFISEEEKETMEIGSTLEYNEEGGGYKVSPEKLNATLFIKYWKNSWAKALLPYHPEFLRLVWCDVYAKPSADFLADFENSTYSKHNTFNVSPGITDDKKDKIYTLDPYFVRSGNFAFARENQKNEWKIYIENELEKQVLQHHYCSNASNDVEFNDCIQGRKLDQYESMQEEEWFTLKNYYLSKRKIYQEEAAIKAIADANRAFTGVALSSGSFMQGDNYIKFKRKDLRSGDETVRINWQDRILRFYDSENAANECIDRVNNGSFTYQPRAIDNCDSRENAAPICNQGCASQTYFQGWLNRLVVSNTLLGTRLGMIVNNSTIFQETFLSRSGIIQSNQVVWKGTVSASGDLEGRFWSYKPSEIPNSTNPRNGNEVNEGQSQPYYVNLLKPGLEGFNWNTVVMFTCITVSTANNPYSFSLNALLSSGATVQINGTTNVFNLLQCQQQTCENLYTVVRTRDQGSSAGINLRGLFGGVSRPSRMVRYRKMDNLQLSGWSESQNIGADFLANAVTTEKRKTSLFISFIGNPPPNTSYAGQRELLYTANIPETLPQNEEHMFNFGLIVKGEIDWQLLLSSQVTDQQGNLMPMPLHFISPLPVSQGDLNEGIRRFEFSMLLVPKRIRGSLKYPRKVELFVNHPNYSINNADSRGNPLSWLELHTAILTKIGCKSCCWQSLENTPPLSPNCKKEFEDAVVENEMELRTRHINLLIARFKTAYLNKCLESTDVFNVGYKKQWYMVTISQYDLAGNLIATVPPKGVVTLSETQLASLRPSGILSSPSIVPAHTMVSEYRYNTLNQPIQVKTPDAGVSKVWYNLMGQVVMSQSAVQGQSPPKASYLQYDAQGRPTEEGELVTAGAHIARGNSYGIVLDQRGFQNALSVTISKANIAYTRYDRPLDSTNYFSTGQKNLRGRVSSRWVKPTSNAPITHALHYSYDILGYVADFVTENKTLVVSDARLKYKTFHYDFDLFSGHPTKVAYQAGQTDAFYHHFVYDADNRLQESSTSLDGSDDFKDVDSRLTYYRTGQQARLEIGSNLVQGTDFAFTIQGWPKFINIPDMDFGDAAAVNKPDVFTENMQYFSGDYKPIGTTVPASNPSKNLYTGLLAATFQTYNEPDFGPIANTYKYDQSQRLTAHTRGDADAFSSLFTYDANGNMTTLKRKGESRLIDDLSFSYVGNNNRLASVIDDATHADETSIGDLKKGVHGYEYDENGALLQDDEGKYDWFHFGKIRMFQTNGNGSRVSYSYDANRRRVGKRLEDGNRIENTWYVLDPNGQLAALYTFNKNENPKASFAPIYSVKRLGIYQYPNDNPAHIRPEDKHYEMHNHLGDVVATINGSLSRNLADGSGEIMVENMAEYYPYGFTMPTLDVGNYRFGFNGMEKDRKGEYTTEYRQYDARIGRWKSVDALAQKYPGLSPFSFANNNPVSMVDPSGLSSETPVVASSTVYDHYLRHNQTYTNEDGSYNREAMYRDKLLNEQELNATAEDFNSKIGYQALLRATARSINERMPNKNAVSVHQAGRDQLYADFARVNGWEMVDSRFRGDQNQVHFEYEILTPLIITSTVPSNQDGSNNTSPGRPRGQFADHFPTIDQGALNVARTVAEVPAIISGAILLAPLQLSGGAAIAAEGGFFAFQTTLSIATEINTSGSVKNGTIINTIISHRSLVLTSLLEEYKGTSFMFSIGGALMSYLIDRSVEESK